MAVRADVVQPSQLTHGRGRGQLPPELMHLSHLQANLSNVTLPSELDDDPNNPHVALLSIGPLVLREMRMRVSAST